MKHQSPAFDGWLVADIERRFLDEMARAAVASLRMRYGVVASANHRPHVPNSNLDRHGLSITIVRDPREA